MVSVHVIIVIIHCCLSFFLSSFYNIKSRQYHLLYPVVSYWSIRDRVCLFKNFTFGVEEHAPAQNIIIKNDGIK